MFKLIGGRRITRHYPKTASTTLTNGFVVAFDGSGALTSATISAKLIPGVVIVDIASTDSDFASNTKIPVTVNIPGESLWEADITGTLTTAMVGNEYDLSADGQYVAIANTTTKQVKIEAYISASKAIVRIKDYIA